MLSAGILFLISSVVNIGGVPVRSDADLKSENVIQIMPDIIQSERPNDGLNGVLYKTANKYYCSPEPFRSNSTTILYGTNGWTFPKQDVFFTLSYPTVNQDIQRNIEDYRISGYKVIMFTDGLESSGYIAAGGLMQAKLNTTGYPDTVNVHGRFGEVWLWLHLCDTEKKPGHKYPQPTSMYENNLTLKFTVSGITTLAYEFWLYGAPSTVAAAWLSSQIPNRMC